MSKLNWKMNYKEHSGMNTVCIILFVAKDSPPKKRRLTSKKTVILVLRTIEYWGRRRQPNYPFGIGRY